MPDEPKVVYISPELALGALTPSVPKLDLADLGPSAPHQLEPEPEEAPTLGSTIEELLGKPPRLGSDAAPGHYTNMLDEIWAEFDEPEERTAARLGLVLEEVKAEAQRVHLLSQAVLDKIQWWKLEDSERERFNKEFQAYLRRLIKYRDALDQLEPEDTDTMDVHVGLIRRRLGAGPVPDAIIHMYFAEQLGILAEHADDMGEGFVGRVMEGLAAVDTKIDDAADAIDDAQQEAKDRIDETLADWSDSVRRGLIWAGGILAGTLALVGGTVAIAVIASKAPEKDDAG